MDNISDVKIEGIDEARAPSVEHKTYINLIFKLSTQVPALWCEQFNTLMSKHPSKAKVDMEEGQYIETWVKSPAEIPPHLELLKKAVKTATELYVEQIRLSTLAPSSDELSDAGANSPQGLLNTIIADLDFDT